MKKILFLILIAVLTANIQAHSFKSVISAKSAAVNPTAAEKTVREFYQAYLTALVKNKKLPAATLSRYLTKKMLAEKKRTTDADVIIQAQDYDDAWAKNIKVSTAKTAGDDKVYLVVKLTGENFSQTLSVTAVLQNKTWKIDDVNATKSN